MAEVLREAVADMRTLVEIEAAGVVVDIVLVLQFLAQTAAFRKVEAHVQGLASRQTLQVETLGNQRARLFGNAPGDDLGGPGCFSRLRATGPSLRSRGQREPFCSSGKI
eukprot:m.148609 g.148609  ORF g.148609 m.148609 type:complete len:109 (-) comp23209_c0_seq1:725-1051(-)